MVEIIKKSVSKTLDLFTDKSRSYYAFSVCFMILSFLFSRILGVCLYAFFDFFYRLLDEEYFKALSITSPTYRNQLTEYVNGVMIITLGLYAFYVKQLLKKEDTKPSLKEFWFTMFKRRTRFLLVILVYTVITVILNGGYLQNWNSLDTVSFFRFLDHPVGWNIQHRFFQPLRMLDMFMAFLLEFFPYVLALYLVVTISRDGSVSMFWKKYKENIAAMLLMAICITPVIIYVSHIVNLYSESLTTMIMDRRTGLYIESISRFFIGAYFILLVVGVILYSAEKEKKE